MKKGNVIALAVVAIVVVAVIIGVVVYMKKPKSILPLAGNWKGSCPTATGVSNFSLNVADVSGTSTGHAVYTDGSAGPTQTYQFYKINNLKDIPNCNPPPHTDSVVAIAKLDNVPSSIADGTPFLIQSSTPMMLANKLSSSMYGFGSYNKDDNIIGFILGNLTSTSLTFPNLTLTR